MLCILVHVFTWYHVGGCHSPQYTQLCKTVKQLNKFTSSMGLSQSSRKFWNTCCWRNWNVLVLRANFTIHHSVIIVTLCVVTPPYFTFFVLKCRRISDVGIQLLWWHHVVLIVWRKLFEFTYTLEFLSSCTQGIRQVQDCKIFWIFKLYLYWSTFLKVVFCYCLYSWAAQLIIGVFYAGISFSCWLTFKWLPSFYFVFLIRYFSPAWLCNIASFIPWLIKFIFSILLQRHISKLSRYLWSIFRSVQV